MSRANDFFSSEKFGSEERKERRNYLIDYTKRNHQKYGIRQVQVDKMLELSEGLFVSDLKEFFETLPSAFQKAFKSAWRQKLHKAKSAKKTVELSERPARYLEGIKAVRQEETGREMTYDEVLMEALDMYGQYVKGKLEVTRRL